MKEGTVCLFVYLFILLLFW